MLVVVDQYRMLHRLNINRATKDGLLNRRPFKLHLTMTCDPLPGPSLPIPRINIHLRLRLVNTLFPSLIRLLKALLSTTPIHNTSNKEKVTLSQVNLLEFTTKTPSLNPRLHHRLLQLAYQVLPIHSFNITSNKHNNL